MDAEDKGTMSNARSYEADLDYVGIRDRSRRKSQDVRRNKTAYCAFAGLHGLSAKLLTFVRRIILMLRVPTKPIS